MSSQPDDTLLPVIRAALDQTRSAACITTADLDVPGPTIVYVNPAYCAMTGRAEVEVLGASPRIMQGPLTSREVLDDLRADLEAGGRFSGEAVNYTKAGKPFLISWRIEPVVGPEGTVTHFVATQSDITAVRRAERLLEASRVIDGRVSTLLSQPSDPSTNVSMLVTDIASAIDGLVDYGIVGISGSIRLGTSATPFQGGQMSPVHQDLVEQVQLQTDGMTSDGVQTGVVGGRHWLGCSITNDRSGVEGAVVIADLSEAQLEFTDRHGLDRAVGSARRALDSLAEYERQRLVAIELQRDLLPDHAPVVAGLELAVTYQPGAFASRVGGDWYDVIPTGSDQTVLVVGDMTGSGIRAAADMGRVRLLMRVLVQQGMSVPEVFDFLNRFCADEDLLATALAVTIDPASATATMVSAGHLPPVVRRDGEAEVLTLSPRPLLGFGGDPDYGQEPLSLVGDPTIVVFTDGLIERPEEPIDESMARLVARVAADEGDWAGLGRRLVAARMAEEPGDDIALLVLRLRPVD